jgi:Spy/CpxP family protein refolding chaperone
MNMRTLAGLTAILCFLSAPVLADEAKEHGKGGYGGGYGGHGYGFGHHGGTGHYLRHLMKHQKEIGLSDEQVAKLKTMELDLDKARIRAEADIQVVEREAQALIQDEKSSLGAIEAKLKQSESLQTALRMTAIKTKRDAMALLTPEQRDKEKAEHEKMMKMMGEHRMKEMHEGMPGGPGHPPMKGTEKKDAPN